MAASDPNFPRDESAPAAETPEEFARWVEEIYAAAYRFAFSLCGNHADAGDVTQQAFFLAQTRGHQLRDATKRKPWLFTILHREFLRGRRRQMAHGETPLEFSEHALPLITVDHAAALDSQTTLRVLATIDENFRMPLVLFYLDQLSYKEIAAALEVPIGTVMSRLARGKKMLRERLETQRVEDLGKVIPLRTVTPEGGAVSG